MTLPLVDRAFPPDESDEELGDVYETLGHGGVLRLLKARAETEHPLYDEMHVRYVVAEMFGVSPGDLVPCAGLWP